MPKVRIKAQPERDDDDDAPAPSRAATMRSGNSRLPPYSVAWFRDKIATYALGTIICGATMVAAAAWMGGSLGAFGKRMDSGMSVIMHSAGLSVEKIRIVGLEPLVEQRARDAAGVDVGTSMLTADPYKIKQRIEKVDAVGGVSVHRFWPNQITIIAETRQPVALWQDQGGWRVIDQHGKTFAQVDPNDYLHLPRITGRNGAQAAAGLLATIEEYPDLKGRIDTARRVGGRRWDVKFRGGVEVALPEDDHLKPALRSLNLLEDQNRLLEMPLARIDARHPERFALRPSPVTPSTGGA
jgi:cell division protein FtsQ